MAPNMRLKLSGRGGRLVGNRSLLIAAAPDRSLSAIRYTAASTITKACGCRCARHDLRTRRPLSALGRTKFQQLVPEEQGKPAPRLEASTAAAV